MRLLAATVLGLLFVSPERADRPAPMQFGAVREIAPGVFFRYSSISPTDPNVFGGSNHAWVVFEDHVVVIDANFPREAADVVAAIRKTTDKPIRYVLDTHHHGDHAYGNVVWAKAGATIVAQRNCARLLRLNGPAEFAAAGKGPTGRKDVAATVLKQPSLVFDDRLVLDDGTQRVEFLYLGHSHTIGDAIAWLPKHRILCTGDACVNGPYNYMGHAHSASWIRCLEKMQALDPKLICPGHGLPEGPELLRKQQRYFVELRQQVRQGIDKGQEVEDIVKAIDLPWYKEWTTVPPAADNVRHVYNEFMGLVAPWEFEYDLGILAGPSPTKDTPGWTKPKRIVVPAGLTPAQLTGLKRAAPVIEFVPARSAEEAARLVDDADAVLGHATTEVVAAGKRLRWVQAAPGGVTPELMRALNGRDVTVTASERIHAPQVADATFALLLGLTRNLLGKAKIPPVELRGKTLLVLGLGGAGEQIARRGQAFGMRVLALDDEAKDRPAAVARLDRLARLREWLPEADVVVLALPLTAKHRGLLGSAELKAMKRSAFLVNAAHTSLIDLDALADVLAAGAGPRGVGLDTTDVGPLPADHPLRQQPGVLLTAHSGAPAPEAQQRLWRFYRENVRRFAAGEPLLGVVERSADR